jgi:hypothetical protein
MLRNYLITSGLVGEPIAPVIGMAGASIVGLLKEKADLQRRPDCQLSGQVTSRRRAIIHPMKQRQACGAL